MLDRIITDELGRPERCPECRTGYVVAVSDRPDSVRYVCTLCRWDG